MRFLSFFLTMTSPYSRLHLGFPVYCERRRLWYGLLPRFVNEFVAFCSLRMSSVTGCEVGRLPPILCATFEAFVTFPRLLFRLAFRTIHGVHAFPFRAVFFFPTSRVVFFFRIQRLFLFSVVPDDGKEEKDSLPSRTECRRSRRHPPALSTVFLIPVQPEYGLWICLFHLIHVPYRQLFPFLVRIVADLNKAEALSPSLGAVSSQILCSKEFGS